jgi:hypothetical protein
VRAQRDTVWSAERETRATLDAGRDGIDTGNRLLGGVASAVSKLLDVLADMIAPAPPPTRDQAERMHRAAEEREAADVARRETDARLRETNEMIRANQRAEAERQAEEERIRQRQREQEQGRER